jgi:hypothetical protein
MPRQRVERPGAGHQEGPPVTNEEYPWKLPLRARDGTLRGWALVDESDYHDLARYRWALAVGGYAVRKKQGRTVYLHRELLGLDRGAGGEVDHMNRDKLDNRRGNLRIVPRGSQPQNMGGRQVRASRSRGVTPKGAHWGAQVGFRNEQGIEENVYLGVYKSEEDAAAASAQWRHAHFPFANEDPALLARRIQRRPPPKAPTAYQRFLVQHLDASTTLSRRSIIDLVGISHLLVKRILGPGVERRKSDSCLAHE